MYEVVFKRTRAGVLHSVSKLSICFIRISFISIIGQLMNLSGIQNSVCSLNVEKMTLSTALKCD